MCELHISCACRQFPFHVTRVRVPRRSHVPSSKYSSNPLLRISVFHLVYLIFTFHLSALTCSGKPVPPQVSGCHHVLQEERHQPHGGRDLCRVPHVQERLLAILLRQPQQEASQQRGTGKAMRREDWSRDSGWEHPLGGTCTKLRYLHKIAPRTQTPHSVWQYFAGEHEPKTSKRTSDRLLGRHKMTRANAM